MRWGYLSVTAVFVSLLVACGSDDGAGSDGGGLDGGAGDSGDGGSGLDGGGDTDASEGGGSRIIPVGRQIDGAQRPGINRAFLSADGTCVVFRTEFSERIRADTSGKAVWLLDLATDTFELISVDDEGAFIADDHQFATDGRLWGVPVSADCSRVVFTSDAVLDSDSGASPGNRPEFVEFVYLRDRNISDTRLVSPATPVTTLGPNSSHGTITSDGRFVFFRNRDEGRGDVRGVNPDALYRYDTQTGTSTFVPIRAEVGGSAEQDPSLRAVGTYGSPNALMARVAEVWTLGLTGSRAWILIDGITGDWQLLPIGDDSDAAQASQVALSPNGSYAAIVSDHDPNTGQELIFEQLFLVDTQSGEATLLTRNAEGGPAEANSGRWLAFSGDSDVLVYEVSEVPGAVRGEREVPGAVSSTILRYRISTGETDWIAETDRGEFVEGSEPTVNYDGTAIGFECDASDFGGDFVELGYCIWSETGRLPDGSIVGCPTPPCDEPNLPEACLDLQLGCQACSPPVDLCADFVATEDEETCERALEVFDSCEVESACLDLDAECDECTGQAARDCNDTVRALDEADCTEALDDLIPGCVLEAICGSQQCGEVDGTRCGPCECPGPELTSPDFCCDEGADCTGYDYASWLGECTNFETDDTRCGDCDTSCDVEGTSCRNGECRCPGASEGLCDGVCVDLADDPDHCDECGNACEADQICSARECTCPGDTIEVCGEGEDARCANTLADPAFCGDCDTTCGAVCSDGDCADVEAVTAAYLHSCALLSDDTVQCWGSTSALGAGDGYGGSGPVAVFGLDNAASIVAGVGLFSCATTTDDLALCWGSNTYGQRGNGSTATPNVPSDVTGLTGVMEVAAGGHHACARLDNEAVWCWGRNHHGQLGNDDIANDSTPHPTPQQVVDLDNASQLALGFDHSCALTTDDTVVCWGYSEAVGADVDVSRPEPIADLDGVQSIGAGHYHTCAILEDTTVWCWGGGNIDSDVPVQIVIENDPEPFELTGVVEVDGGQDDTCVRFDNGDVVCWNNDGSTGPFNVGGPDDPEPVFYPIVTGAVSIGLGSNHRCAALGGGGAVCWGENSAGQLGDGTETDRQNPEPVVWYAE